MEGEPKKKALFVMGGLGDSKLSNVEWELEGARRGWKVMNITPAMEAITADRDADTHMQEIVEAVRKHKEEHPDEQIILVGQSAGGEALLRAAMELDEDDKYITVSPAVPRGINPLSFPLMTVMWKYLPWLITRQVIDTKKEDYKYVIQPGIPDEIAEELANERAPIAGTHAAQLAGAPLGLQPVLDPNKIKAHTLLVTGAEDRWVNPKAHRKLAALLSKSMEDRFMWLRVPKVGHMPANAADGDTTVKRALDLVEDEDKFKHQSRVLAQFLKK